MSSERIDVEQRVIGLISQVCVSPPKDIRLEDRLREDLGLDSVCSMELLSLLAEELDLDIDVEEAVAVTTVAGTIAMARKHLGARAA